MSTNGKTLKFRAAKLKGFTVLKLFHSIIQEFRVCKVSNVLKYARDCPHVVTKLNSCLKPRHRCISPEIIKNLLSCGPFFIILLFFLMKKLWMYFSKNSNTGDFKTPQTVSKLSTLG